MSAPNEHSKGWGSGDGDNEERKNVGDVCKLKFKTGGASNSLSLSCGVDQMVLKGCSSIVYFVNSEFPLTVYGNGINKNADVESLLEIETLTLCHLKLAVNSRAEMEIGRYHWMYPGSKNHQYRPVPTLGDRAGPLSSPGKYSLGANSHSKPTVLFRLGCTSSFTLLLFPVLLDALICS